MPPKAPTADDLSELLRIIYCNSSCDPKQFKENLAVLLMSTWKDVEEWGDPGKKRMAKVGWKLWGVIEKLK
jgi:hypothetical protein